MQTAHPIPSNASVDVDILHAQGPSSANAQPGPSSVHAQPGPSSVQAQPHPGQFSGFALPRNVPFLQ